MEIRALTLVSNRCPFLPIFAISWGFPGGSLVENPPANTGDAGDEGSIPGSERSPGEGNGKFWEIPWTEEPGGLQFMELQRLGHDSATERACTHTHTHVLLNS